MIFSIKKFEGSISTLCISSENTKDVFDLGVLFAISETNNIECEKFYLKQEDFCTLKFSVINKKI